MNRRGEVASAMAQQLMHSGARVIDREPFTEERRRKDEGYRAVVAEVVASWVESHAGDYDAALEGIERRAEEIRSGSPAAPTSPPALFMADAVTLLRRRRDTLTAGREG